MSNDDIDVSQVRWDDEQGGNTFDEQNEAVPDDVQWDEPEQLYSVSDRLESMGSASVDAPESVAKWKDLSSRAGVSYDVAKAIPDQVEKKLKKPDWQTMVTSAPKTSQYLADNPRDFEIAKDDVEPLQELETFRAELKKRGLPDVTQPQYQESPTAALNREIFSNSDLKNGAIENTANPDGALRFGDSPGEFVDNAGRVASTVTGALGTQFGASLDKISAAYDELTNRMDIVGFDDEAMRAAQSAENMRRIRAANAASEAATPTFDTNTARWLFGGVSSLVQTAPTLAVGAFNPLLGLTMAGIQSGLGQSADVLERGGSTQDALIAGGAVGLIEGLTEKLPFGFVAENLGKMGVVDFAKKLLSRDMIGEQVATHTQDFVDAVYDPYKTMDQYLSERPEAAIQTAFGVGVNAGTMAGVQAVANRVMKFDASKNETERDLADLDKQIDILQKTKAARLDRDVTTNILNNMDDGDENDVYVDSALFHTGVVTKDVFLKAAPSAADQIDQAIETGGLIRVPRNELLVGLSQNADIRNDVMAHVKANVFGDTQSELANQQGDMDRELEAIANQSIAKAKDKDQAAFDFKDAADYISAQLDATGYGTKEGNKTRAILLASRASVIAFNNGMKPVDVVKKYMGGFRFDPKNETLNSGGFNQYAGEQALNADLTALQRAKQAVDSGADPEQTRQETGWHKWEDGKWRFEIDDSASNIRFGDVTHQRMKEIAGDWITTDDFLSRYPDTQEAGSMRLLGSMRGAISEDRKLSKSKAPMLNEVLDHPALFAAYPDLAAVRVVIDDSMPIGEAAYMPENDVILLSPVADNAQKKSLLLHEVQHAIQEREGFARGGSVDEFMSPANNELAARKSAASEKVAEINAKLKTATGEEYQQLLAERSSYVADAQIDGIDIMENANDQYKRLAGEVEARDTGSRAGMSAEERKANKPYISQGIPDDQVIVRMGDGGLRSNAENDAAKYNADAAPTELSDEAADDLVTLYQELGSDDDNFQYARETGDDLDADIIPALPEGTVQTADEAVIMAAQMDAEDAGAPDIVDVKKYSIPTKELLVDANDKPILKDGKKQYTTQKRDAYVYINDAGEYWTDLSDLKRAGGVGGIIYTKVADFAEKNGGVFRGDPLGLSDDALLKRTEHMASGIARRKDTGRFIPHERQLTLIDKDHATSPLNTRARAMKWVKGNDTINRREIVKTAFHNITQVMPELRHAWIDPDTGRILVRGTPLNTKFRDWVHELQKGGLSSDGQRRTDTAGAVAKQGEPLGAYRHLYASASIKRQLLANTLARYVGESAERRRQILDRLGEISKDLESYDGRKLFYQSKKTESAKESPNKKRIAKRDADYMAAVERGDMEAAQKLVNEAAAEAGYVSDSDFRMTHSAPNSADGFSVSLADVRESGMVPADYWTTPRYYLSDSMEFVAHSSIVSGFRSRDLRLSGESKRNPDDAGIVVYRAIPKNIKESKIRNGDWVTPSMEYARNEGLSIPGGYKIISQRAKLRHLYWDGNSPAELGFDNGKGYAYKNTKNNRKLADAVTRDEDGNIVPLSKRFNARKEEEYFQGKDAPRGTFDPVTRDITMLAKADLSTFLHETGHLFLEIQAELALDENASERMKSDMDTVLQWFGVKGENASERLAAWNAMTLEEKRKFHEKYAESFEQYLFEGKAPSAELNEVFQTFRAWLSHVYTSIKNFLSESGQNADLNDEIRSVFDRMLATEEQIAQAQQTAGMMPMYASRPEGVSDAEWEAYQQAADEYVQAATEQLSGRALRDLKWVKNAVGTKGKIMREMRREAAALRREARMEARTRFLSRPIVQAYQFLTAPVEGVKARNKRARNSEHVDTARDSLLTAIAKLGGLNKGEAVSQYGIDPKDFLRKGGVFGKPVLRVDGGLSPDAMAEALAQHNYLPLDEHGKWDIRDLEDLLRDEAAGNPQYSADVDMDVLLGEPQRAFFDTENVEYMGGRLNRIDIRNMFDDIQLAEMAGIDPFTGEKVADMSGQLQQPAFHGSPYKFDKFSLEHIGKGEGAQAYGWGLYFAGNKEVAEYYRETLAIGKGGNNFRQMAVDALAAEGVSVDDDSALTVFQRFAMEMTGKGGKPASYARKVQNASAPMRAYDTASIGRALQTYVEAENKGQLYKVDIPEDDTYLLWDKPLIAQSEKVKAALRSMDNRVTFGKDRESVKQWIKITGDIPPEMRAMTGGALYSHIAGKLNARHDSPKTGSQQASEYLHSIGIRGIKYLDGSSRGAGDGNYNYVIFDDSAVKILETYYQLGDKDQPQSRTLEGMGVLSDDGIPPELVAGYFGMETEQLIRGLLGTPELGDIKQAIENMTDQIMLERHADLATPEAIAEATLKAVMNKARAKFVATEYAILAKATGSERVLQRQAKDYAGRVIGATKVKDVKPEKFIAAAAKAGKEAQKAMAKSDTKAALLAKRNQVLNEATAKLAVDVKEEIDKFDDLAAKIIKATNEKNAKRGRDPDVVNAITAVMGFYGFYPSRQQNAMEYLERVREHDPDMFLRLQDAVNRAAVNQKDFNDLTINEMRGLREEIEGLWYTAKRSRQMEIDGKKIDLQEAADGLVTRLLEVGLPDEKLGAKNAPTEKDLLTHKLKTAGAWLTRVEQWAERMDGQWGGAFTRYIFQPVKKAADRYRTEATEYNRRYVALIDALPKMKRGLIAAPELGYTFGAGDQKVGMAELLHAVLHTGNASNKRKLLLGRGWAVLREDGSLDTARWDMFVERMHKQGVLKKEHYDFAQGVWDLLEDTKAGAQKTHRDVFGYYFAEVTADAFGTPFGIYRGGYVPAQADPRLVVDAAQRAMAEEENNTLVNAFPATAKGFTKGRTEYNKPLMLDLQSLAQHINKVLLFTHMEPAVRDVKKLLMRNDVAETLGAVDRAAYDSMLTPWLSVAARQSVNTPVTGDAGISNAVNIARNNTGMALMAANLSNAMQQITGFLTATQKVKGKYILRETASFLARPKEYANEVRAASEYMAVRMDAEIHAINSQINELLIAPTAYQKTKAFAARHAYFLQAMIDNIMSPIIWRATFNQSVEKGMTDADAEQYANATIRQTQGSSLPEDVSRVEVGGAFWRATMQFYGYFNSMVNTNVVAVKNAKTKSEAMGHIIYGAILPAIVAQSIAVAMRGGVDDDDYDGWLDDWITEVAGTGLFRYATAMIPVVGAFVNLAVGYTTKTPVDDRMQTSATTSMIGSALRSVDSVPDAITGNGKPSKAIKDVAAGISLFTGLPVFALARPVGYAADVAAGEVVPTSGGDMTRGLLTGTASPDSN